MKCFWTAAFTLLISPTRFAIERRKHKVRDYGKTIRRWNVSFRCAMLASVAGLYMLKTGKPILNAPFYLGYFVLWLFPFSRINELGLAFYQDAFQRFGPSLSHTGITPVQRLRFLVSSYFEVAIQFGILFFCFPSGLFTRNFQSIIQAIYFSSITISTVGYGDITPTSPLSQLACMYELAVGFILLIFALGSYLSTSVSSEIKKQTSAGDAA